mmetsp:Transcript_7222/g.14848  ORF Transcript_7222/g.14848 Transcript_7222/m.14848 type:complete len:208 (+) Transcript_7222:1094-1717(+)
MHNVFFLFFWLLLFSGWLLCTCSVEQQEQKPSLPLNSECACKVKDEKTQETNWILGTIMSYHNDSKKYEVLDAAEADGEDEAPTTNARSSSGAGSGKNGKSKSSGSRASGTGQAGSSTGGSTAQQRYFKLPKNRIRLVPTKENTHRALASGTRVMALYPDTTVFYPATVRGRAGGDHQYMLEFDDEDSDGEELEVDAKYVFLWKELS